MIAQASMMAAGRRRAQAHPLHINTLESGHPALPAVDILVMCSVVSHHPIHGSRSPP
jgi:hypothetical protein